MPYALVIAGLDQQSFDRVKTESEKRLAPNGSVVIAPTRADGVYGETYISDLVLRTHRLAATFGVRDPFQTLLLYADHANASTSNLLDRFFPYSLPLGFRPFAAEPNSTKAQIRQELNELADRVKDGATTLRSCARVVSEHTEVANLTPLLLPLRNFHADALPNMLQAIYRNVAASRDPKALIAREVQRFFNDSPRTNAPGQTRHCLSDGRLYFQSPGKHRHGHFRDGSSADHLPTCLLNAKSRIGGVYDPYFHYDCIPTKGALLSSYPSCHDQQTKPKPDHVNIAPNDCII